MAWKRGAIGAAVLLVLAQISGVNAGLSRWLTDTHWRAHASWRPTPFPKNILIIAIDDTTLKAIDPATHKPFGRLRYWSRARYAQLLDRLREARAVGFDIIFTEADESDRAGDARLAEAMRKHGRTALACYEWTDRRPVTPQVLADIDEGLKRLPRVARSLAGRVPFVPAEKLEFPIPILMRSAAYGTADVNGDPDGVYRAPVVLQRTFNGALIGHFSLALARLAVGTAPDEPGFGPRGLKLGKRTLPLTNGALWLQPIARRGGAYAPKPRRGANHAPEVGEQAPAMSFSDALAKPPSAFAGKIILIGETVTGTSDVRPNPLDSGLRGVELDAEILANLLYLRPVRPLPTLLQWLLIIAAIGAPLWLYQTRTPSQANAGALIALAAILAVMEGSFWGLRWVPLWSPVLIGFAGTTLIMALQRFAQEEALKRQLRQSFGVYVAHELVEAIVANPEIAHEEGTRRRVAVLFSDVRGFTPYCEQHSPEHVVRQMREYADEMTAAVAAHDGVLDKFLGDGVMALFGPFLPEDCNISALAVSSALEMLDRLEKLNDPWSRQGMPAFRIGIGIHVGDAIVGNIGAANRMQYTALGNTVNLASRLQETTKQMQAMLLVTQEVRDEAEQVLRGSAVFASRGDVTVRGLERSVTVYEVSRGEPEPRPESDRAQTQKPTKTG